MTISDNSVAVDKNNQRVKQEGLHLKKRKYKIVSKENSKSTIDDHLDQRFKYVENQPRNL